MNECEFVLVAQMIGATEMFKKNMSVSAPQTAAQQREMTSAKLRLSSVGSSGGLEGDNLASCFTPNLINPPDKSSVAARPGTSEPSHPGFRKVQSRIAKSEK